jgi:hypothetical protein
MTSFSRRARAFAPDPDAPGHVCAAPDCPLAGDYRAPKSRDSLREFHWFCLQHVREYNAAWDFYKGMSAGEIEAELRADSSWQRPSWPLGRLGHTARMDTALEDQLHAFSFAGSQPKPNNNVPAELRDALGILGLIWPVSLAAVKAKYKELAKRHHPDANGGDKRSEEMLKTINLAYATLRGKLAVSRPSAAQPAAD